MKRSELYKMSSHGEAEIPMIGQLGGENASKFTRPLDRIVYAATIIVFVALTALAFFPPQFRFVISPATIQPEQGLAYIIKAPRPPGILGLFSFRADHPGSARGSDLVIFENGQPLPLGHAAPDDLRDQGAGRFLHWRGHLYLTATDNTDPRTNGRFYEGSAPLHAPWLMKVLALLLSIASAWCYFRAHPRAQALSRSWATALFWPFGLRLTPLGGALLGGLALIAGLVIMLVIWRNGWSTGTSLTGFLPVSDGKGHHECAQQLIDFGKNDDWCHRRPIYSVFLAGLYVSAGRDLVLLHIAQAGIVMAACVVFAREAARWIGIAGASALMIALLLFSGKWIFGQTMTEAFGLTVGLLGQAVLLRAAETRSLKAVGLGVFLVSVALNARPGAVLTLGVLVLWAFSLRWRAWREMAVHGAVAVIAVAGGFAVHSLCMLAVHGDLGGSYGNLSLTTYGLSVGRDWSSAVADHPELMRDDAAAYGEIYRLSFANFAAHPEVLIRGLWDNFQLYVVTLWNGWLPIRNMPGAILIYIVSLAAIAKAAFKSRRALLVLVFMAGDVASSLLIARDGELRAWAATIATAQMLPLAFTLSLFGRWLSRGALAAVAPPALAPPAAFPRGALALGSAIAFFMGLTASGAVRLAGLKQVAAAPACTAKLTPYVFTLGNGAAATLTIDNAAATPQVWPRRVSSEDFQRGMPAAYWFSNAAALPSIRIIQAEQALVGGPQVVALYAPTAMQLPERTPIAACVDRSQPLDIAGAPYDRIVTAAPLR